MGIRGFQVDEQFTALRTGLRSVWTAIYDNQGVRILRKAMRFVRTRWLAFCFTRRFYTQACRTETIASAPASSLYVQDLTECLIQRSLPSKLHALVQLRVASQIASIAETTLRAEACRRSGWSDDQIRAATVSHAGEIFPEPELLALRYADEMTRTPIDVDPQTVRELRRYFSSPDIMELTASIAHENFRCRFSDANNRVG